MILIIMRHGEAVGYREPDHARALTSTGVAQCEGVGKWLSKNLLGFSQSVGENLEIIDIALISPYLRTQQTCRAVGKHVKISNHVTIDAITPMGNAQQSADLIHGFATDSSQPKSMLVVTHMPLVSLLSDKVCSEFNAKIYEPADTLLMDYDINTGLAKQLAFYQGI